MTPAHHNITHGMLTEATKKLLPQDEQLASNLMSISFVAQCLERISDLAVEILILFSRGPNDQGLVHSKTGLKMANYLSGTIQRITKLIPKLDRPEGFIGGMALPKPAEISDAKKLSRYRWKSAVAIAILVRTIQVGHQWLMSQDSLWENGRPITAIDTWNRLLTNNLLYSIKVHAGWLRGLQDPLMVHKQDDLIEEALQEDGDLEENKGPLEEFRQW